MPTALTLACFPFEDMRIHTVIPIVFIQVDLRHYTLIVAVKHDGHTGKEIDSGIHSLGFLDFDHPALTVASDEESLPFPRRSIVDVVILLVCGIMRRREVGAEFYFVVFLSFLWDMG